MTESGTARPDVPAFEAFLSHRYASAGVNLHFFDITRRSSEVQFEVDEGSEPISMTRLSRMVRDADAFIGIYPLPQPPDDPVTAPSLATASRYFRLELDLATRARKPTMVFYDERYRANLRLPTGIFSQAYDPQEVLGGGGAPSSKRHDLTYQSFTTAVRADMDRRAYVESLSPVSPGTIGLLVPAGESGYTADAAAGLVELLEGRGYDVERIAWPPALDAKLVSSLRQVEWVAVAVDDSVASASTIGFLHGHAVPMLRLHHTEQPEGSPWPDVERSLFGAFDVGYVEDLLAWRDSDDLLTEFAVRLDRIDAPVRRVSTSDEATTYFRRAQLRKEPVFVSYASEDRWAAEALVAALADRFQQVFDYRDGGESLPEGVPWMSTLYSRLHDASLGIVVLSSSWKAKRTCVREGEFMMARADAGKMTVVPLNVDDVEPPAFLSTEQFRAVSPSSDFGGLVDGIVARLDTG